MNRRAGADVTTSPLPPPPSLPLLALEIHLMSKKLQECGVALIDNREAYSPLGLVVQHTVWFVSICEWHQK